MSLKPKRIGRVVWLFAVGGTSLAGLWAFWLEPSSLTFNDVDIELERWPAACSGLEVVLLADFHVGSPHYGLPKLREVIAATNESRPDLVLLAGDYVIQGVLGGRFVDPDDIGREIGLLNPRLGTFGVLGNHDWWHNAPKVSRALAANGVHMLEDDAALVEDGSCRFWIAGIGDLMEGAHDIDAALSRVTTDAPVLALTHNPDVFVEIPDRVLFTFAGHTHGGQVNLPIVGRLVVPSAFGDRFAIGHIVEEGRHLYVNPGLGTSILPVRFRVPPEITTIRLRSE